MQLRLRNLGFVFALGLALLAGGSARADFQIFVLVDGTLIDFATDNGANDTNSNVGQISFDPVALNNALAAEGQFVFTNLGARSNAVGGTSPAELTLTGEVSRVGTGDTTPVLTIITNATDYFFPEAPAFLMFNAMSDTYTGAPADDSRTHVGYLDLSNTDLDPLGSVTPVGNPSPVLMTSSAGVITNPDLDGPVTTLVPNAQLPYALTIATNINLSATAEGSTTSPSVQFTSSNQVVAIPEPSAVLMLGLGLPVIGLIRARVRKA